jgi:hypothetical protein
VTRLTERRIAHARAEALLVAQSQFVDARGDDVAVGRDVAGVQSSRGAGGGAVWRGLLLLFGDLLLSLDLRLIALILTGGLVRVLRRPVPVALGVFLLELA